MTVTTIQERLLGCVARDDVSDCWEWTGQVSNSGYGRCKVRDGQGNVSMQSAQYVSYEAFIGRVPAGMLVRQSCGNRLCVNPQHLQLFDPAERHCA
jgi:hypothetical protein